MANISLTVENKIITASAQTKDFVGLCNNTGYTLEVTLDSEWNYLLGIKAIFRNDNEVTIVPLTQSSSKWGCEIPVFDKDGKIYIGICYVDTDWGIVTKIISTNNISFRYKRSILTGIDTVTLMNM